MGEKNNKRGANASGKDRSPASAALAKSLEREKQLQIRLERIENAVSAMGVGFVLFDKNDHLVIKNNRNNYFDHEGLLNRSGTQFRDWVIHGFNNGIFPEAKHGFETWLENRVQQHLNPSGIVFQDLQDGRTIQIEENKTPDGGTIGTYTDVTNMRDMERSLNNSQQKLRQVSSNFPGVMFQFQVAPDGGRSFGFIGEQCKEILGVSAAEIYADSAASRRYVVAEDSKLMNDTIQQSYETMVPWRCEYRVLRDGQTSWLRGSSTPSREVDGRTVWDGIIVDITEIKNAERLQARIREELEQRVEERTQELRVEIAERQLAHEELFRAKEIAEKANRSKTEFLANMSHELRTPLNAIMGFAEIMESELLGPVGAPKYKEYLSDIHLSADHLVNVISDILDISRIESGHQELDLSTFDFKRMIEDIIRLVSQSAISAGVELHYCQSDAEEPQNIRADEVASKQMLFNLVSNAIKFTDHGGQIDISHEMTGEYLDLHVQDSGIGISEENMVKVVEPFFQAEGAYFRQHHGTGLGLALTKTLIELHGGRLAIESVVGAGTRVTLRFPYGVDGLDSQMETI